MRKASQLTTESASVPSGIGTPYYVKACALGIPAYLIGIHLWTWVFTLSIFLGGRADFRQLYAAGYMVRTGHSNQLYDYDAQKYFQDEHVSPAPIALPFIRPAYQAAVFAPLSYLPYRQAYFVFLAINVAILGVLFVLLLPWMRNLIAVYRWFPLSLFLGFLPLAAALIQGQDSILLTGLLIGAFVLLARKHDFLAGSFVGLGLFKFQVVIPIAVLFLLWRCWRFVLGFTAALVILASVSAWMVGSDQTGIYVRSLFSMAAAAVPASNLLRYPVPLQTMANFHGFAFGVLGGKLPQVWVQVVTFLLSGAVILWTALRGRRISNPPQLLLLALPCSVLVSYYAFIHDLSVLLLPMLVLLNFFLPYEGQEGKKKERWISRSAALMFVAPVAESFFPEHFYLVAIAVVFLLLGVSVAVKSSCSFEQEWRSDPALVLEKTS